MLSKGHTGENHLERNAGLCRGFSGKFRPGFNDSRLLQDSGLEVRSLADRTGRRVED